MRCRGELKSLRAQSVDEVSAYLLFVQFSGYVEMKVSQVYHKSGYTALPGVKKNTFLNYNGSFVLNRLCWNL